MPCPQVSSVPRIIILSLRLSVAVVAVLILSVGCGDDEPNTPVVVSVEPATVLTGVDGTTQFTATVTGTEDSAVTWSVDGGAVSGAVTASGVYTGPAVVPNPDTVTLRATSQADPTKSGTATVTIAGVPPQVPGFVGIPAGSFVMGDGVAASGIHQHQVTLTHGFYIGQTEVTNQQYLEGVQLAYGQGYVAVQSNVVYDRLDGRSGTGVALLYLADFGSEIAFSDGVFSLRDAGHGINANHPVKEVTWYGAVAYCDWLSLKEGRPRAYNHQTWQCNAGLPYSAQGYRLPTDAEWEYAAQYDDERIYPWGNQDPACTLANIRGCVGWTSPVGSHPAAPTISGQELFDMAGNVLEWCNDWSTSDLGTLAAQDPLGPASGTMRVHRGGQWSYGAGQYLRCAYRGVAIEPEARDSSYGFRVARTMNP